MTRRDYFLACLNVHLTAFAANPRNGVYYDLHALVERAQSEALRLPEEAIPGEIARAALDFFVYAVTGGKPAWLTDHLEIVKESEGR